MKKYDVTIGIPIYNSASCIRQSLMSALAQSYSSIEYLLVDDGCTDGTFDIIKTILSTNNRCDDVRIISHDENQGVSAARNHIIKEAHGVYLYFMDSDDTITENAIELLMENARCYDAEIVFGSYEKIETSGSKMVYQYPSMQFFMADELANFAYRKYAGIQASACNLLVKVSILRENELYFIGTNYWEDLVFTYDLVTLISRAILIPDITYYYLCRSHSLSHYQEREIILKDEVMQNVKAINHLKKNSSVLCNKDYFPNRCNNIIMTDFYIVCTILKRRNSIVPYILNHEIKSMMSYPADWKQICSFRQSRLKSLLFFVLSKMPSFLCVAAVWSVGKLKKLI